MLQDFWSLCYSYRTMTLNKALRWISILSIFAIAFVPLVVSSYLFFPYITGKNVLFRALVEIGFGAWLILAFRDRRYRLPVSFITVALGAFLFILFIADLHGVYWYKSFWSNFERMEGLVTHIHLFLYFLVVSAMIKGENLWRRFFQTSLCCKYYRWIFWCRSVVSQWFFYEQSY